MALSAHHTGVCVLVVSLCLSACFAEQKADACRKGDILDGTEGSDQMQKYDTQGRRPPVARAHVGARHLRPHDASLSAAAGM